MSLIPSSKGTTALVALVIAMAAVGTAAAVTAPDTSAPDEAQVGEEVSVSVTLSNLYSDNDEWTLRGTTQLTNVTGWEVTKVRPAGNTTEEYTGQDSFETNINRADNVTDVVVTITGDAPPIEEFQYDPPQQFEAAKLAQAVGQGESDIETVQVHHYTNESRQALNAIRDAEEAVEGSDSNDARNRLEQAKDAYNVGNFGNAESIANDAKNTANEAKSSQDTMTLILYGVGALVVLALIGGGVYYYRNQQDSYDKLR